MSTPGSEFRLQAAGSFDIQQAREVAKRGRLKPELRTSEMPQNVGSFQLDQVSRHILDDFRADLRFEFLQKRMINFLARGQETTIDLLIARQRVESLGQLPHKPFARFQL